MRINPLFQLAKSAFSNWRADYAPSMGAALSYYTVFSIAPLLVIVIAVAALIFGVDAAQTAILKATKPGTVPNERQPRHRKAGTSG